MPRWLLWTAVTVVSWGVWAVLAKVIGDALTGAESHALSSVGMLPVVLALVWSKDQAARPSARRGAFYALAAGVVSGLGNVPYYDLYGRGASAAAAVSLTALAPVVTIALAVAFLGERVNRVQALGLALALVAIYLFNVSAKEEKGLLSGWLAYAFLPIALWGTAGFLSKLATGHVSGERAALLVLVGFVLVSVGLLAAVPWPAEVTGRTWGLVAALGFFLAFGNYTVVLAYAGGKASIVTPLAGLYPVVSVPVAVLAFGETIEARTAAGIACALAAVLALSIEGAPSSPG